MCKEHLIHWLPPTVFILRTFSQKNVKPLSGHLCWHKVVLNCTFIFHFLIYKGHEIYSYCSSSLSVINLFLRIHKDIWNFRYRYSAVLRTSTLLDKFWRISLYLTDEPILQSSMIRKVSKFPQIEENGQNFSHIEQNNSAISLIF